MRVVTIINIQNQLITLDYEHDDANWETKNEIQVFINGYRHGDIHSWLRHA